MPAQNLRLKINLLKKEEFESTFVGQFLKWALTYGRYIIIITQIVVLSVFFLRFKLDRDHVDLKESIEQKQALLASVKEIEDEVRSLQERLTQIKTIESTQYIPLNILTFLQDNTPVDITYQNISLDTGALSLSGRCQSLRSLSSLLLHLKKSNKFTEITLDDIKRNPDSSVIFQIGTKFSVESFRI
ncbi:PilN domain-containing protein [Candidatus Gottesmanbacteria bacterium]|nr:PilN domain-containing protein [Candidatus Gottesmanbacteria bacterium]